MRNMPAYLQAENADNSRLSYVLLTICLKLRLANPLVYRRIPPCKMKAVFEATGGALPPPIVCVFSNLWQPFCSKHVVVKQAART